MSVSAAVERWWAEIENQLESGGSVDVHLDELLEDGYKPATAATDGIEAYQTLLGLLGKRLEAYKPIAAFPLADSTELDVRPPDLEKLDALLDDYTPPSLILVARGAFGRNAILMEEYGLPLRLRVTDPVGFLVWSYRVWRSDADDPAEYARSVYLEHYFTVSPEGNTATLLDR